MGRARELREDERLKRVKVRIVRPGRAGNAGLIASIAIAFIGVAIGAIAAYVGEQGASARASREPAAIPAAPPLENYYAEREKLVRRALSGAHLERLPSPLAGETPSERPKIIIIFDDMGIDRHGFERALNLPGPLTFSFLPYARGVDKLTRIAAAKGEEIMLHLPMQPDGDEDPGPHALREDMTGAEFIKALEWNLGRFDGYVAVNNHMGSKLTADEAAMKTVLGYLKGKGVFFIDSLTTPDSVARTIGPRLGEQVFARDVFLDAVPESKAAVRQQLDLVERIARETGYAVVICHPHPDTLDVLGPWLATAPMRGFELAPVSALLKIDQNRKMQRLIAMAPTALRQ